MKVLMINGSPHADGCTFRALSEIAKALKEDGVDSEIVQIGNGAIHGCIGCGSCGKLGHCVFTDGPLCETVEKAKEADGLIVGSPVYYASPNGSILSFMDRLFCSGGKYLAYKPAAAIASARRAGTTATLDALNKYFMFNRMPVVSSNYWNMVHGTCAADVEQDLEGLQIMRGLGHNMAWMLKCIEAGKEKGIECPEGEAKIKTNFIR
ncbi:MAG: flavodoxin family protein [Lachnospiraceae bacterium]|nr:flavodoxin family protein [Lachnospiraceae bacterium]